MILSFFDFAFSFGIRIVNDEAELREAADIIFKEFDQPVLAEQYIEGREINVGLLGNGSTLETFQPAELTFGAGGPNIYTEDDKKRKSGREVGVICPAPLDDEVAARDVCARLQSSQETRGRVLAGAVSSHAC